MPECRLVLISSSIFITNGGNTMKSQRQPVEKNREHRLYLSFMLGEPLLAAAMATGFRAQEDLMEALRVGMEEALEEQYQRGYELGRRKAA